MKMNSPTPCNIDIFENGKLVGIIYDGSSHAIDVYIKYIAKITDEPVDWHYCGGRGRILTTGNVEKVKEALISNMPKLYIEGYN